MKRKKPKSTVDEILDIEPEPEIELEHVNVSSEGSNLDAKEDYKLIREKLITSIVRGSEIMEEVTRMVKGPDGSGYAVDASSKLLKSMSEATKGLLEIHEKIRVLDAETKQKPEEVNNKTTLSNIISMHEKRKAMSK